MDTKNPSNFHLVSSLKDRAASISMKEAQLESAPQLILQLYIFLTTGNMSESFQNRIVFIVLI